MRLVLNIRFAQFKDVTKCLYLDNKLTFRTVSFTHVLINLLEKEIVPWIVRPHLPMLSLSRYLLCRYFSVPTRSNVCHAERNPCPFCSVLRSKDAYFSVID